MQLGFSRIKKLKYLTSTMNAGRTRTVVVTIGTRSQALDATLLHTVPFFCSHAWHGMACAVADDLLRLKSCTNATCLLLHLYVETMDWTAGPEVQN